MSYFDEVYLKRMNKDGLTRQERIKTKKENEFNKIYLQRTEYQGCIYKVNRKDISVLCSLQPNKYNESALIGNLLISTSSAAFKTGDILHITQKIKNVEYDKIWIVVFVSEDITHGYQLFKVICLDEEINITDEYGTTLYSIPVKIVNAKDTFVQDTFQMEGIGYREPKANRTFITHDFDCLIKGTHFLYKDRRWELYGKDNLSIDGVSYTCISEKLMKEEEPQSSKDILVGEDTNFFLNGR